MLTALEGIYRNGKIELSEIPTGVADEAQVIVTFVQQSASASHRVTLRDYGINPDQAAELRARLMPFAEGWEQPEMDAYDNYDAAKSVR